MYCTICTAQKKDSAFSLTGPTFGSTNFKTSALKDHETSTAHKQALVERAAAAQESAIPKLLKRLERVWTTNTEEVLNLRHVVDWLLSENIDIQKVSSLCTLIRRCGGKVFDECGFENPNVLAEVMEFIGDKAKILMVSQLRRKACEKTLGSKTVPEAPRQQRTFNGNTRSFTSEHESPVTPFSNLSSESQRSVSELLDHVFSSFHPPSSSHTNFRPTHIIPQAQTSSDEQNEPLLSAMTLDTSANQPDSPHIMQSELNSLEEKGSYDQLVNLPSSSPSSPLRAIDLLDNACESALGSSSAILIRCDNVTNEDDDSVAQSKRRRLE
jgi:hypothetical protein